MVYNDSVVYRNHSISQCLIIVAKVINTAARYSVAQKSKPLPNYEKLW